MRLPLDLYSFATWGHEYLRRHVEEILQAIRLNNYSQLEPF